MTNHWHQFDNRFRLIAFGGGSRGRNAFFDFTVLMSSNLRPGQTHTFRICHPLRGPLYFFLPLFPAPPPPPKPICGPGFGLPPAPPFADGFLPGAGDAALRTTTPVYIVRASKCQEGEKEESHEKRGFSTSSGIWYRGAIGR